MKYRAFIITIVVFILFEISGFSQVKKFQITQGSLIKDKKKTSKLLFSGDDGSGGLVVLRIYFGGLGASTPKGYYLEHYNNSLRLINQKEISIENSAVKNIFVKDGVINLIEYRLNKDDNTNDYFTLSYDLKNFQQSSKKLFSINQREFKKPFFLTLGMVPISNYSKIDHDPTGEVIISRNKNYILFNFDIKNDSVETQRIIVYDSHFQLVYDKIIESGVEDKYFQYHDVEISDDDGSAYFLGKAFKNNSLQNRIKNEINYEFELFKVNENNISKSVFYSNSYYINTFNLVLYNGKVFCIGGYSERDSNRFKGLAFYQLNTNNLLVEIKKFNPIPEQFFTDKYGDSKGRLKKDSEKEVPNFLMKNFIIGSNGDMYFCAEEYFVRTFHNYMSSAPTTSYTYNYRDVYLGKIKSSGELDWFRTINKKQKAKQNLDYFSYSTLINSNRLYIFLNGSDKIKKLSDDRIEFKDSSIKNMNLYALAIDKEGNFDYEIIIPSKDSKMTYKVKYGAPNLEDGSIIFEGNDGKNKQIVRLSLE